MPNKRRRPPPCVGTTAGLVGQAASRWSLRTRNDGLPKRAAMGRDKGGPYGREVSGSPPVPARSAPPTTAQDLTWVSFAAAQIFLSSASVPYGRSRRVLVDAQRKSWELNLPRPTEARPACEGHFGTNPDLVLLMAHAGDVTPAISSAPR
jgi:hypothetical protein